MATTGDCAPHRSALALTIVQRIKGGNEKLGSNWQLETENNRHRGGGHCRDPRRGVCPFTVRTTCLLWVPEAFTPVYAGRADDHSACWHPRGRATVLLLSAKRHDRNSARGSAEHRKLGYERIECLLRRFTIQQLIREA